MNRGFGQMPRFMRNVTKNYCEIWPEFSILILQVQWVTFATFY